MKKTICLFLALMSIFKVSTAQSNITWGMGMNIASSASGNHHPRIVADAAGNPLVLWGHSSRAMFSRWNGTGFTTPVMLNPMTMTIAEATFMGPDIASHGDTVYVVFKQTPEIDTSSHIYIIRSLNGGISFSVPVRVDGITDTITRFPTVTTDAAGNPIVAYMKFNISFGNAQWAVAKSADFGNSFSSSVLASRWSSATSTVCDCCPGSIATSGNTVAMLYRDNNSNIRDMWAGISTDGGISFTQGVAVDQGNWMLMACPGSGPDGVIVSDTLYTVYMSETTGTSLVWISNTPMLPPAASTGITLTGPFPGLAQQNFPRIAQYGNAMAIVWNQTVSGTDQLPLLFTDNINNDLPSTYDTVDLNYITNVDVALANGNIFIVWQDDNSGTVKYRKGTFTLSTGAEEIASQNLFFSFPNPALSTITLNFGKEARFDVRFCNTLGEVLFQTTTSAEQIEIDVKDFPKGIYFIMATDENKNSVTRKVVKM